MTLFSGAQADAPQAGFEGGNDFTVTRLIGEVSVQCHRGIESSSAFYRCQADRFEPGAFARFETQSTVDADQVTLHSKWENGTEREKTEKYDSKTGKSKRQFDLFIATLFQRPLLYLGTTIVNYTLKKAGASVQEGSFKTTLVRNGRIWCRPKTEFSSNMSDCKDETRVCNDYFFYEARECR